MKRLIVFAILVTILVAFALSNISDTRASVTNTVIPENKVSSSQSKADNSSASATITITMYALPEEEWR